MICSYCKEEGQTSRVYPGNSFVTLMAVNSYYDEDGKLHTDNPNTRTTWYECSRGHQWAEATRQGEPASRVQIK